MKPTGKKINIEKETIKNNNYRKVLQTTPNMQLVLMCLLPGEDIPEEVHRSTSQFFRIEQGTAKIRAGGGDHKLKDGDVFIVPPNTKHRVQNIGKDPLKFYTIYAPPEHPDGLVQKKKPTTED